MTELSVVIPAYDAAATLAAQLDALAAQEWDGEWEVVVVDNRSADGTADLVRRHAAGWPRLHLVAAPDRAGGAYARNVGVAAARGPLLAFCDADDVVGPRWVAAMGDGLRRHHAVTGPLELDRLNPPWLAASRGRAWAGRLLRYAGAFPVAHGCNVGVRRDALDRVGGWAEDFTVGYDVELSLRLWQAGVELAWAPDALVHYRYRPTLGALFRQARAYGADRVALHTRMRAAGVEPPPPGAAWRSWAWLARHLPSLRTRAGRARWVWVAGNRLGEARGRSWT